jgi:hypothetical protein
MAKADLRRVERAAAKIEETRRELRAAILSARSSGETFRDIAEAASLTPQRVQQIVSEARPPKR